MPLVAGKMCRTAGLKFRVKFWEGDFEMMISRDFMVSSGEKNGIFSTKYLFNVCEHEECYKEVGSQAVSYTTGVPAMIGAALMVQGIWEGRGVFNMEQLDPDPFMSALNEWGLPWQIVELDV